MSWISVNLKTCWSGRTKVVIHVTNGFKEEMSKYSYEQWSRLNFLVSVLIAKDDCYAAMYHNVTETNLRYVNNKQSYGKAILLHCAFELCSSGVSCCIHSRTGSLIILSVSGSCKPDNTGTQTWVLTYSRHSICQTVERPCSSFSFFFFFSPCNLFACCFCPDSPLW